MWLSTSMKTERLAVSHDERLQELGIVLPEAQTPMAAYVPAIRTGDLLWIAGQPPGGDWRGRVGETYDIEAGARAARDSGLNILAQVRKATGSLDAVVRVVKVIGFVNAAPSFDDVHLVVNGCSELMQDVFGDAGRHTRSSLGCSTLPMQIPCEIEAMFQIQD